MINITKFLSTAFFLCYAGTIVCTIVLPHFCPHIVQLNKSDLINLLYFCYIFYFYLIYRLDEDYYLLFIFIIVVLILSVFVIQLFFYSPLAFDKYTENIPQSTKHERRLSKVIEEVEDYTPFKNKPDNHCCNINTENSKLIQSNSSNSSNPSITTSPIQIPHATPNITPNPISSSKTSVISETCASSPMNESRRRRSSSISLPGSKTVVPLCENEYKNMYEMNKSISPNYEIAKSIVDDNLYRICRIPLSPEQALDPTFLERINKLAKLNHPYLPRYYKAWFERKDTVSNSFITAARLSYNNLRPFYSVGSDEEEEDGIIEEDIEIEKEKNVVLEKEREKEKEKNLEKKKSNKCLQLLFTPSSTDEYDNGICDSPSTYETYFRDAAQLNDEENGSEEEGEGEDNGERENQDNNNNSEMNEEERKRKRHLLSNRKHDKNKTKTNNNKECYRINHSNRIERVPSLQNFNKDYILYIQIQFFHAPSLKEVLKLHKQV